MWKVALASTSSLKKSAVENLFQSSPFYIHACSTQGHGIPEQPINSGQKCARRRLDCIEELNAVFSIAIENEIVVDDDDVRDVANVCVRLPSGEEFFGRSTEYTARNIIPKDEYEKIRARAEVTEDGMSLTLGKEYFGKMGFPHDNWHLKYAGFDRKVQIREALLDAFSQMLLAQVQFFPDFPKPGVAFQYQGKIWSDPMYNALLNCVTRTKIQHLGLHPTKVVGLDSRGYISGAVLAHMLGVGFVCVTKAGKTPGTPKILAGSTEYSQIELELNPSLITSEDSVLIIDDLVATGGSLLAASSLVKECGTQVCACVSILKVGPLFSTAAEKLGMTPVCILE